MPIGSIEFLSSSRHYGFIAAHDASKHSLTHIEVMERSGFQTINKDPQTDRELTGLRSKVAVAHFGGA